MSFLKEEMDEFVKKPLPLVQKRQKTFFDIAGFPHYETVMSRCYAYFLSSESGDQLSGVFMDALLQLIKKQSGKELLFDKWEVTPEVTTNSGNRIDILITSPENSTGPCIIIENKIYHWLDNDLNDYWNYSKSAVEQKIGIVLSLFKQEIPDEVKGKFINILHSEYIESVLAALDKSLIESKSLLYLEEFFTSLNNLKTDEVMNEQTLFYLNNLETVNKIVDTKFAASNYVIQQLKVAAEKLSYVFSGNAYEYRYIEVPELIGSGIFYTITFNNLFTSQRSLRVVIEVQEKVRRLVPEFNNEVLETSKKLGLLIEPQQRQNSWLHYVGKDYSFSIEEMKNLGELLAEYVKRDFEPVMKGITKVVLRQSKN